MILSKLLTLMIVLLKVFQTLDILMNTCNRYICNYIMTWKMNANYDARLLTVNMYLIYEATWSEMKQS